VTPAPSPLSLRIAGLHVTQGSVPYALAQRGAHVTPPSDPPTASFPRVRVRAGGAKDDGPGFAWSLTRPVQGNVSPSPPGR
jgi:hypothetical protein